MRKDTDHKLEAYLHIVNEHEKCLNSFCLYFLLLFCIEGLWSGVQTFGVRKLFF